MRTLMTAFAKNRVFANIVLVLIFLAGAMAATGMIRENFPEFSLDMITIQVAYPGADPEEVEEGISRKIEEAIEGLEGIKMYTTSSAENSSYTTVEVREDYDADEVLDRVRNKVDSISTFPTDAEKPIISELMLKEPVVLLYLSGNMSEKLLKEWAESLKDEIQQIPHISQVSTFGTRDYEIGIEISEERLREYNLTFEQVAQAVRRSNMNLAGGTIRTTGEEIRVRTMGRKYTGAELASIVVSASPEGDIITLDRVAKIRDGFTEDPMRAEINGERSVLLIISKTPEEDALAISKAVNGFVKEKKSQLPSGANLKVLYDNTGMLQDRIDLLPRNGVIGLCLVFGLLWLFLDLRLSFWAGMGIPVSVSGALAIIWGMGDTINMVSLFGLIMVLGILVDDAIVVGESIYVQRQTGVPPLKAAVDGVCEVGMPVVAAVVTSVVAFVPLAFVGGVMGKFIAILPKVVIACLVISLVECLILLPAHLNDLPAPKTGEETGSMLARIGDAVHRRVKGGMEWFVHRLYVPFLKTALQWRYIAFCTAISILLLTLGLVAGGLLKFEVFPEVDGFVINANVEFPSGTPQETTEKAVRRIDEALLRVAERTKTTSGEPLLEDRLSFVGMTFGDIPDYGPHVGGVQAILLDSEKRGVHSKDLMVALEKEVGPIPGMKALTISGMQHGPPGSPIEVWLQGHDMGDILSAADDLMARLRKFDGVYQVRSDFSPGKNELRLALKPEARALGLTVEDLARQVYAGYYGEEAVRLQRGRDDIRVRVRYAADERRSLSDLEQVRIRTPQGYEVPLFSVADCRFAPGYSTITRTDGMRRGGGQRRCGHQQGQRQRDIRGIERRLFPATGEKVQGASRGPPGRAEENAGILLQSLCGFSPGHAGHFHHHRHHFPFLRAAFRDHVHDPVRNHRRDFGTPSSGLHPFDHEHIRLRGAVWGGGQRRHRVDREDQRKPGPGRAFLRGYRQRRNSQVPGHRADHPEYGGRSYAFDHGDEFPGQVFDSHGVVAGCGRGVRHRSHAGADSLSAGDSERFSPGGDEMEDGPLGFAGGGGAVLGQIRRPGFEGGGGLSGWRRSGSI